MFGTESKQQKITKGNKSGPIKKIDNKLRAAVSGDQIQSDHPGLVPQFSYKRTNTIIWASQFMVNHCSELTYFHLTRSTSQE